MTNKIKKIVLAYSGGLDTSVMLRWLIDRYQCEVVCYCADVGQGAEMDGLAEKAKATGASKLYVKTCVKSSCATMSGPRSKPTPFMKACI